MIPLPRAPAHYNTAGNFAANPPCYIPEQNWNIA
jgi:hypothetical protein